MRSALAPVRSFSPSLAFLLAAAAAAAALLTVSRAGAAPAPVGATTATSPSTASLSVARPGGTVAGDVLLATVTARFGQAVTITPPSGWTFVRRDTCLLPGTQMTQALYVRTVGTGEPTSARWTFSKAAGASAGIAAYRGIDGASPVVAHSGATAQDSRTANAPSVTTTAPQTLVAGSFGRSGTTAVTTPAGTTRRYTVTGTGTSPAAIVALDQVRASAGATGTISTTSTGVNGCTIGQLVALRPAPVADTTKPTVPGSLRTTGATPTSISVAWNASTDDVGVTGYGLYRDNVSVGTTTTTTYTFAGLACGRTYALGVDAVDAAGNRSARATINASTSACGSPPPPPPPPPPPSGGEQIVLVDKAWTCSGPVNLALVKVTIRTAATDAIFLRENCSGRIGRIEVETWTGDGVKVNAQAPVAHDLVVEGGFVRCHAQTLGHQDGIQAMGGQRVTFRNLELNCNSNPNAQLFVNAINGNTPADIVCDGCLLGSGASSTLRVNEAIRSGLRNSLVCPGRNYTLYFGTPAVSPVNVNNSVLPASDPRC